MGRIKVALVGCGYWGSKLKRYIEGDETLKLVKVCNSKTDLDEVWHDKVIPAVVVATPMATHYAIVKAALFAGKGVLCAKPLAFRTAECEELKEVAEERGLPLLVDYTWTFSRGLEQAQTLIKQRLLGKVASYLLAARQWGRFDRENVYWLLMTHLLSILDMFTPIAELTFSKTGLECKGVGIETAHLAFKGDGVVGLLDASINYPGKEVSMVVNGEDGTLLYSPMTATSLRLRRYDGKNEQYFIDETNNLAQVIKAFSLALKGRREGNAGMAVAVTRVIEGLGFDKS